MDNRTIILLVGKSGSGKSTLAQYMVEHYGWKEVLSYTTRPPRYPDEDTHLFVDDPPFDELERTEHICAYTEFDGYIYGATDTQVDKADIYVIDPDGVEYFLRAYQGRKVPIVVYLKAPDKLLVERMRKRGDSEEKIKARIENDKVKFKACDGEYYTDYVIPVVDEGVEISTQELGVHLNAIQFVECDNIRKTEVMLP